MSLANIVTGGDRGVTPRKIRDAQELTSEQSLVRIVRTMQRKRFLLELDPQEAEYDKLLSELDWADIIHIQYSGDLMTVEIVYLLERRVINRKEYDANLPELPQSSEEQEPNVEAEPDTRGLGTQEPPSTDREDGGGERNPEERQDSISGGDNIVEGTQI